jgi:SAM-dependent methyltransferase
MRAAHAVSHRLNMSPWEKVGTDGDSAFLALLDREEFRRGRPYGRALDLGCGTGAHTRQLQERGWEAVGVDNVRVAVDRAMRQDGVEDIRFVIGDVDHLPGCGVGKDFSFFLDMGCFHGLRPAARREMGRGVTQLAAPGATLLMLCFEPQRNPFVARGADRDDVQDAFPGWTVTEETEADPDTLPRSFRHHSPRFYRLALDAAA